MSNNPDETKAAFPSGGEGRYEPQCGMSLRQFYAAVAMHGLMTTGKWNANISDASQDAVTAADAMIRELDK